MWTVSGGATQQSRAGRSSRGAQIRPLEGHQHRLGTIELIDRIQVSTSSHVGIGDPRVVRCGRWPTELRRSKEQVVRHGRGPGTKPASRAAERLRALPVVVVIIVAQRRGSAPYAEAPLGGEGDLNSTALWISRLTTVKTLAGFDFAFQPSLDRNRLLALAELLGPRDLAVWQNSEHTCWCVRAPTTRTAMVLDPGHVLILQPSSTVIAR